jgi:hypothetical protein
MPWPTPQDYNEAIQNPALNLDDPELKAGTPELTPLGLPRPITGGFASVYRMRCGQRDWAVRCFLREIPDQQRRYAAISRHLAAVHLPYTVGFAFLPQGIKVRGQWHPILKMEWVQGEPLNTYVEKHLHESALLSALADRWLRMMAALQQGCVAHGDLQHGNVLITNGDFKLIDYDGMFVPGLAGQASHEIGHRNYQHPRRAEADFGPYLDHFSAWVIYLSLVALSVEPGLWAKVGAGDEHLLFRQGDFERPAASDVFAALNGLNGLNSASLRSLAAQFQAQLTRAPRDVPALESQIRPASSRSADWLKGALTPPRKRAAPAPKRAAAAAPPAPKPAWVVDQMAQTNGAKAFREPMTVPRGLSAVSLLAAVSTALSVPGHFTLLLTSGLLGSFVLTWLALLLSYLQESAVRERRSLRAKERALRRALQGVERALQACAQEKARLDTAERQRADALTLWKRDLEAKERRELAAIHAALKAARDSIQARRRALDQDETAALEAALARFTPKIEALDEQIAALDRALAERLGQALEAQQAAYVADFLHRQKLWRSDIPGLGAGYKLRLLAAGLTTAADIEYDLVRAIRGIGERRAMALHAWRQDLEARAHATMPVGLSAEARHRVGARYEARRRRLETRRDAAQSRLTAAAEAVRARFAASRLALDAELNEAQAKAKKEAQALADRYGGEYGSITQTLAQLAAEAEEKRLEIEEKSADIEAQFPAHRWQQARLRRELVAYQHLSFRRYARRLFWT